MFHVGDIITGTTRNIYGYTNDLATMKVLYIVSEEKIQVEILTHEEEPHVIGHTYTVESCYFRLLSSTITDDMIANEEEVDSLLG